MTTWPLVESLKNLPQAQYICGKARALINPGKSKVRHNLAEECYEAEKMLGPGRNEYLRATFKNQRSTKPNMIIYSEDGMEFIRSHCGDKSAQNVTLVIDKVPSIKDISLNSILLPSFTIA